MSVVIGILTYRNYEVTRDCLQSLRTLEQWPVPTLIVDNASGTGEGARLAAELGEPVSALTRPVNDGLGGGYNAAIAWAMQLGASHALLLNNDVQIGDPKLLTSLLDASGPTHAAVGPVVRDPDGSIWSCGGWVDWRRGLTGHYRKPPSSEPYDAAWLDGPCLLVSLAVAGQIGGLSPDFFMYYEDADWGIRAGRAGYPCLVQPQTSIIHLRGGRSLSPAVVKLISRNRMLFMRRNATLGQNLRWLPWLVARESLRSGRQLLRSPRSAAAILWNVLASFGWNVADAVHRRRWTLEADGPPFDANWTAKPEDAKKRTAETR